MYYRSLSALLLLFTLAGCSTATTDQTTAPVDTATTHTTPVVEATNATNTSTTNIAVVPTMVDTSEWLTFSDVAVGIEFLYPNTYTIVTDEIIDFSNSTLYDQELYAGKSRRIVMQSTADEYNQITFIAHTADRKGPYDAVFTGGNVASYCSTPGQITSGSSYCTLIEVDTKEWLYRNTFVNMECSPRFMSSVMMNNPNQNSDFTGLIFDVALPDVQHDLLSPPYKNDDPCAGNIDLDDKLQQYLQINFTNNNLSIEDKKLYEIMQLITQSVQSF